MAGYVFLPYVNDNSLGGGSGLDVAIWTNNTSSINGIIMASVTENAFIKACGYIEYNSNPSQQWDAFHIILTSNRNTAKYIGAYHYKNDKVTSNITPGYIQATNNDVPGIYYKDLTYNLTVYMENRIYNIPLYNNLNECLAAMNDGNWTGSISKAVTIPVCWNRGGISRNFLRNSGFLSPKIVQKLFPSVKEWR